MKTDFSMGGGRDLTCLIRAAVERVAGGDGNESPQGFRRDMSGLKEEPPLRRQNQTAESPGEF